ncbi:MAG: hypothetical protein GXO91_03300 [FCB group bacterium]|nr:hypothetical protein [FCB group bacterium]
MKLIWKLILIMWLLPAITTAQACCSLQGHYQSSVIEQYPYSLNFPGADVHSLMLTVRSGNDLSIDAFIKEGPAVTVSLDYQYRTAQILAFGLGLRTLTTRLQEEISFEPGATYLISTELNGRLLLQGIDRSLWIKAAVPLFARYTNRNFPFKISPTANLEVGGAVVFGVYPHVQYFSAALIEELGTTNLFRFRHRIFLDYRIDVADWKTLTPYISLKNKFGVLKSIQTGVYQNTIQETAYDFGVLGAGVNWRFERYPVVIRLDWTLPVLRWSADRLPAGFTENPSLNLSYSGPIQLK